MGQAYALVVGVSDYSMRSEGNLPFAYNDIQEFSNALITGLNIPRPNITILGKDGLVSREKLREALRTMETRCKDDDNVVFYFSGHGDVINGKHYIVCSDLMQSTNEIINLVNSFTARGKIIILDACMSGDFALTSRNEKDFEQDIEALIGTGCAVFASCSPTELSWSLPQLSMSSFTNNLCSALVASSTISNGKKTLYAIKQLLFLIISIFNKRNPSFHQSPIYKANLVGTIEFEVAPHSLVVPESYYYDSDSYCIVSVDSMHNTSAKRYSVKIVLKNSASFDDLIDVNKKIIKRIKYLDLNGSKLHDYWHLKPVNIVFCYFGYDMLDVSNGNYYCRSIWVDHTQNKSWWYRSEQGGEVIDDICFIIHKYYDQIRTLHLENTADSAILINNTKDIIATVIKAAEFVISNFNEFEDNLIQEEEFVKKIAPALQSIEKAFGDEGRLDFPDLAIKEWSNACSGLIGTVHDFVYFYGEKHLASRTPENRKSCLEMAIRSYYSDLCKVRAFEEEVQANL